MYPQNTNTRVIAIGSLRDVNTQNAPLLDNPSVGDILYVAVGGGYTNIKPTGSANLIQNIGKIGRVQQNNGEILVSAIQRANDIPNLPSGYTWVGNGDGVATPTPTSSIAPSYTNSTPNTY